MSGLGTDRVQGSYNDGKTSAAGEIGSQRAAGSVKKDDQWASVSLDRRGSLAIGGGDRGGNFALNRDSNGRISGFGNAITGPGSALRMGGADNGSFRLGSVGPGHSASLTRNGMGVVDGIFRAQQGADRFEMEGSSDRSWSVFGEDEGGHGYLGRTAEGDYHTNSSGTWTRAIERAQQAIKEIKKIERRR